MQPSQATPSQVEDGIIMKDLRLHWYDLQLLGTASAYDLREKAERRRSARDLTRFFFRVVEVLQPDVFIEAGAKDASSSRRAATCLKSARIVAFEANPYTHQAFQMTNAEHPRVEYVHRALTERPGEVTFHVNRATDGSPMADGRGSIMRRLESEAGYEDVTVHATSLDAFFAGFAFRSCALWIDVEGASKAVLAGATDVLHRTSVLIIEVEDREYWKGSWRATDVAGFLYDFGLVPVARDFEYGHQYNVVFLRESLLQQDRVRLRLTQYRSAAAHPRGQGPSPTSTSVASTQRVGRLSADAVRRLGQAVTPLGRRLAQRLTSARARLPGAR